MRTAVLKAQINEYYQLLNIKCEKVSRNGNTYQKISNWKEINLALYKLNEYEFIGNSVRNIFDMGANFMASTESTSILLSDYQKFLNYFYIVKAKCEAILDMQNSNVEDFDDENYLYVKLPNNLKELDDLNTIVKNLNIVFNKCPILSDTYKKVEFVGVDVGSSWLVLSFILTGAPIVAKTINWIADFIKKCNDIRIQNRNIKKMDLEYLINKMEFDKKQTEALLQKVEKGIENDYQKQCMEEFKNIKIPIKGEISAEDQSKIVHCMLKMEELLEMGVELYPSLNASEELKKSFPKKEEWKKITGQTMLLKDDNSKK